MAHNIHYGYTASAAESGNAHLLRITDIQSNKVNWATVPFCQVKDTGLSSYELNPRDILIARTGGTIGKSYIIKNLDGIAVFASYLIRVIPSSYVDEVYLKAFMESPHYWTQLIESSMGTGQPNVNGVALKKLLLPLPPLAEQARIVAKIEELMPYIQEFDTKETALTSLHKNFPVQLKKSILQAAVQGKLVPQDPSDDHADKLIASIRKEKAALIKAKKLKPDKSDSHIFRKGNSFYESINGATPICIDDSLPFPLPPSWTWARLGSVCKKIGSGSTPTGGRGVYLEFGIKFIRSQNVYNDGLRLENVAYISEELHSKRTSSHVLAGDLLLNITGASIGRCAIVSRGWDTANINQHVLILRPIDMRTQALLHVVIISSYIMGQVLRQQVGATKEGLSASAASMFLIPIPPLAEQARIVAKLEELLAQITTLPTANLTSKAL